MSVLKFQITPEGHNALVNAAHNGTAQVRIESIGVVSTHFEYQQGMASPPGEVKRLLTISGGATAANTLHVTIRDNSKDTYTIRGMAVYLDSGTLFGTFSQAEVLAEKSSQSAFLCALDAIFSDIDVSNVVFGDTNFQLNQATIDTHGTTRYSTHEEARAGRASDRAITPDCLRAARYEPGQMVVTAGTEPLYGTLLCNGDAVSRTAYPLLYKAIGTRYGIGDGSTTFNLPRIREGTTIIHTNDSARVGEYSAGQNISHEHAASSQAAGNHVHQATIGLAGAHGHGATAGTVGDHAHSAWTDEQGWHGHTGATYAAGDHQHGGVLPSTPAFNGYGVYMEKDTDARPSDGATAAAGNHAHALATDGAGTHAHNVGMNGAGGHSHSISIATVGDHSHTIENMDAGSHDHTITVSASGGDANLPAGMRFMCCIAY